ncbi:MAG: DUF445 domain-containing protein [Polyangiaceae bacterium]
MQALLDAISHDYLVLLIPPISAFVGWFTNVLAVKMMFYPTEFVGVRPLLGWQGLVPANAQKLGKFSTRLITTKLMRLEELFENFSPESFTGELKPVVEQITCEVETEVKRRAPMMWDNLAPEVQEQVREMIRGEVRATLALVLQDLKQNINQVVDLEEVVTKAILEDKTLVTQLFLEVGAKEFKFIERSGAYFGFLFGLIQLAVWLVYPAWWILPLAGFFVGYATNWLALKLIFEPAEPKRIGPFVLQGLFHKRQHEVAERFAELVSAKLLNPDNIVETIQSSTKGDFVTGIVNRQLDALFDRYASHPMAAMLLPDTEREALRTQIQSRVTEELPKPGGFLHTFAGRAIDIRGELMERMKQLDPKSFEGVLRPAFQQDEWKLIVAGAALGLLAGVLQLVYLFEDALTKVA